MTSETYYPDQRHMLTKTTIRRERLLPDTAASGEVTVPMGARVSLRDVVARGALPSPYVVVDAARYFKLSSADKLHDLLEVRVGARVEEGDLLAGHGGRRGKKLLAPISGSVIEIADGRIILQELSPQVELEAGLNGTVVSVIKGRGVIIEAFGAVLQGVWGNGISTIGTVRVEPSEGLENIFRDMMDTHFRGALIVTRRPLRRVTLDVIEEQAFSGVIAPSMESDLIDQALNSQAAILLTEGFGSQRMSNTITQFLDAMEGRQATLDAILPTPLETRRPEVVINVPLSPGERPAPPRLNATIQIGREIRLTRGSNAGMVGEVISLPNDPVSLDNGLQVPCAGVELITGEKIYVPLANIEVSGS